MNFHYGGVEMKRIALFLITVFFAFVGCATQPDKMAGTYVSPLIYKDYDCDQVSEEMGRLSRRVGELHGSLKKTADDDSTQMAVGMLLLWPTLFFLEGGDGPAAVEYKRLKGEQEALEKVAVNKKCSGALKLIIEAKSAISAGTYKNGKLKQVVSKPISVSFEIAKDTLEDDLDVDITSSSLNEKKGKIKGRFEDGPQVKIIMKKIGDMATEFTIRIGAGEEARSKFVMSEIEENLKFGDKEETAEATVNAKEELPEDQVDTDVDLPEASE